MTNSPDLDFASAPREPELIAFRAEEHAAELDLRLQPELLYFQGHFPETKILPGVVQLDWALRFGRRFLAIGNGAPSGIQLKFRRLIAPGSLVTLRLAHLSAPAGRALGFEYRGDEAVYSTGSIKLTG